MKHVKCLRCGEEQEKGKTCVSCKKDFAAYFCEVCCLYDDDFDKKGVFHCEGCNICRVGGQENTFHCDTCIACFPLVAKASHTCMAGRFK